MREALRHSASRAEAEDAAQEALLRAWRRRARCRTPHDPVPWVTAIARHEALRRSARRADREERAAEREGADVRALDALEQMPARIDLGRALTELEAEDRALLVLRYGADLTQPAVAAAMGLPEGTVKVRLHRLRLRLKERLTTDDTD